MDWSTPVRRLARMHDLSVYVIDLNLSIPTERIPIGWSCSHSPDWGVSAAIVRQDPSASGFYPNSLLIAYSVSGLQEDAFPMDPFADHEAEMHLISGSVIESHRVDNLERDGLAASCSGTYTRYDESLYLEYRYYVYHNLARCPVSWVVETVDTYPYHMHTANTIVDYRKIRKIWEDELNRLLIDEYLEDARSEPKGSASLSVDQSAALPFDTLLIDSTIAAHAIDTESIDSRGVSFPGLRPDGDFP